MSNQCRAITPVIPASERESKDALSQHILALKTAILDSRFHGNDEKGAFFGEDCEVTERSLAEGLAD